VVNIDDSLDITTVFNITSARAMTNDAASGKFYSIIRTLVNQQLVKVCKHATIPIASIKPLDVNLRCLTSGPNGLYAADEVTKRIGRLNLQTGKWTPIAPLPGPYLAFVIAQDKLGVIHYINGNGDYYTNSGFKNTINLYKNIKFASQVKGYCSNFDGNDIVLGILKVDGRVNRYSILR